MISSFIAGRLTKRPELERDRYIAAMAAFDGDRSVRLVCKRKHANQLLTLPQGAPVAVAGLLEVSPVLNERGEPRAYLCLEVTAILDLPLGTGLRSKLSRWVQAQ